MRKLFLKYMGFILLSLITLQSFAQNASQSEDLFLNEKPVQESRHFIHAELAGRSVIWGSLNYEYAIKPQFHLGLGIGLIYLGKGQITRNNNGVVETGTYFDMSTTQMLYGNYFIGQNKHKLLLTAGVTNFLSSYRNKYPTETVTSFETQIEWNAGVGYQFNAENTFYRFTAYCISMPDPLGWFPKYIPWAGITIGLNLN
ncbi:MAG: hypothetical protein PF448_07560 [Bacteroidales bacterium]|jgi:hypothetical protein|nr:hypothetical protein [Bacteroidales bacterium]